MLQLLAAAGQRLEDAVDPLLMRRRGLHAGLQHAGQRAQARLGEARGGLARLAAAEQVADQRGQQSAESAALTGGRLGGARQLPEHAAEALRRQRMGEAAEQHRGERRHHLLDRLRVDAARARCVGGDLRGDLRRAEDLAQRGAAVRRRGGGVGAGERTLMEAARQMPSDSGEAGRVGGDFLQRGRERRRQRLHRRLRLLRVRPNWAPRLATPCPPCAAWMMSLRFMTSSLLLKIATKPRGKYYLDSMAFARRATTAGRRRGEDPLIGCLATIMRERPSNSAGCAQRTAFGGGTRSQSLP